MRSNGLQRVRHLGSFAAGSAVGLAVDLGGFWLLVHAHLAPGLANAASSLCSIAVVYLLVTRRTFRAPLRLGSFGAFVAWYALNIATVSVIVERAPAAFGHGPLFWKVLLVPVSFAANYGFNLLLHRRTAWPTAGRIAGAAVAVLVLGSSLTGLGSVSEQAGAAVPAPSMRIADLFGPGKSVVGRSIVVGGLGSSVGAGATLADPARDAPVAYFTGALERRVNGAQFARWTTINDSVNGSTIHDGLARDWPVLARSHPDVVVLAYGMNDGAPAQFESGETYAGAMHDLVALIGAIRATGAVPVLLTSPSPHTARFNWSYIVGPTVPQQSPVDTTRPVRQVEVPGAGLAPESTRHAAVDAGMRGIAASLDVDLVDVEPYWLRAVASRGQDALFDRTEFVHPDLLGHQLSYHEAIAAWASGPALYPAAFRPGS